MHAENGDAGSYDIVVSGRIGLWLGIVKVIDGLYQLMPRKGVLIFASERCFTVRDASSNAQHCILSSRCSATLRLSACCAGFRAVNSTDCAFPLLHVLRSADCTRSSVHNSSIAACVTPRRVRTRFKRGDRTYIRSFRELRRTRLSSSNLLIRHCTTYHDTADRSALKKRLGLSNSSGHLSLDSNRIFSHHRLALWLSLCARSSASLCSAASAWRRPGTGPSCR